MHFLKPQTVHYLVCSPPLQLHHSKMLSKKNFFLFLITSTSELWTYNQMLLLIAVGKLATHNAKPTKIPHSDYYIVNSLQCRTHRIKWTIKYSGKKVVSCKWSWYHPFGGHFHAYLGCFQATTNTLDKMMWKLKSIIFGSFHFTKISIAALFFRPTQ